MISFAAKNKSFRPRNEEMDKRYEKCAENIGKALGSDISGKIALGRALITLWDSYSYCVKAEECLSEFPQALITNCHQKVFFAVCESEFGLDNGCGRWL